MNKNSFTNQLIGFGIISFGITELFILSQQQAFSIIRLCIVAVNLIVGILILRRQPFLSQKKDGWKSYWAPALLCNLVTFNLSLPISNWTTLPIIIFLIGTILTLTSTLYLGKSFGIRPAIRKVIVNGPYAIVRHPIYLGQFIMAIGCLVANFTLLSATAFIGLLLFQLLRIKEEEALLQSTTLYPTYSKSIKWRLIPFIW